MEPRALHVWVSDVQVWGDRRAPGLLLGWRRGSRGGWEGWVIVAQLGISAHGAGPYVRQGWVPAESIEPRPPPAGPPRRVALARGGHYPGAVRLLRPAPGHLVASGPIDETDLGAFRVAVFEVAAEPVTGGVVDLSEVTYLPSAAIGVLVVARARARARGRRLTMRTTTGSISDQILRVLGLSYDRVPLDAAGDADTA